MSRIFTLGSLVSRCQQRADLVNHAAIGTPEWKENVGSAIGELHTIYAGVGLRQSEGKTSISSGSLADSGDGGGSVALPADYLHTVKVDYVETGGRRYTLSEVQALEAAALSGSTGLPRAVAWALVDANLILYPRPATGQTYEHHYVKQPTDLSSSADGTNVDVISPNGEQFVIWSVVVMAKGKQGIHEDLAFATKERERFRDLVHTDALRRALYSPRRVVIDEDAQTDPLYNGWWARRG